MTTTRAVKLPYLVDVVAFHYLGHAITEARHETWEHGVVTSAVWSLIQTGCPNTPFRVEEHDLSESVKKISLCDAPGVSLSTEENAIVDLVADTYGRMDAGSLGRLTKSINPQMDARSWGKNLAAGLDEDAYARLSASYQHFSEKLPALDFRDQKDWGEPIRDPYEYLTRELGG
jgi:uncharacterized phage-associated protein